MKRKGYRWAKIRGAYRLSRRSIARIIAAISAALLWLHTSTSALTPDDEALSRRAFNAMCVAFPLADSMPPTEVCVAIGDHVFAELAELFFVFRSLVPSERRAWATRSGPMPPVAVRSRRPTRKAITVSAAARLTGLSESTIKRLDRDPKNTNYPGRNSTAKILAAWAKMYKGDKLAAREVRAANRPRLGHGRS